MYIRFFNDCLIGVIVIDVYCISCCLLSIHMFKKAKNKRHHFKINLD